MSLHITFVTNLPQRPVRGTILTSHLSTLRCSALYVAEVIATCDEKAATVSCELDMAQVATRRRHMPLAEQRRGDLYALHDLRRRA